MYEEIYGEMPLIDRVEVKDPQWFNREYVHRARPAVITGVVDQWPASSRWNLDYFRKGFGNSEIKGNRQESAQTIIQGQMGEFQTYRFAELLEKIQNPEPGAAYYLRACPVAKLPWLWGDCPQINAIPNWLDLRFDAESVSLKELNPLARMTAALTRRIVRTTALEKESREYVISKFLEEVIFIGGPGIVTPLHTDGMYTGAYLAQLQGRKHCLLIPPEQSDLVYPRPFRKQFGMSTLDFRKPDSERFPRYREVKPLQCTIGPGDLLYIPHGWWHGVTSLDVSISYSHQIMNEANAVDWLLCVPERVAAELYYSASGGVLNTTGAVIRISEQDKAKAAR